jgi:hypothetical protein
MCTCLATHVYMHRSPRCRIQMEKELEKGRKIEKGKEPSANNWPSPSPCSSPNRTCDCACTLEREDEWPSKRPTPMPRCSIVFLLPLTGGTLLSSPSPSTLLCFHAQSRAPVPMNLARSPLLLAVHDRAVGHQCADGCHVHNPWCLFPSPARTYAT